MIIAVETIVLVHHIEVIAKKDANSMANSSRR